MNELGKAHPAGEARWVRVGRCESSTGGPPGSALAEASEANDLATCTRSVQRELRGLVTRNPHWGDDVACTFAGVLAGSVKSSSDSGTFHVLESEMENLQRTLRSK
jgi:hypothetical protein